MFYVSKLTHYLKEFAKSKNKNKTPKQQNQITSKFKWPYTGHRPHKYMKIRTNHFKFYLTPAA